jgi:hypothetical protein
MELDQLSLDGATSSVFTDLLDYLPGSTATITASGFVVGSTIEFQVSRVLDAGADGAYGTINDTIDGAAYAAGAGHEAWYIAQGVRTAGATASRAMPMTMAISTGSR